MALSEKEVIRTAELARITISEDEKKRFGDELTAILDFVRELNEVDTEGVSPMTGGTREENALRPDEPLSDALEGAGAELFNEAPGKKNRYISVPAIFE